MSKLQHPVSLSVLVFAALGQWMFGCESSGAGNQANANLGGQSSGSCSQGDTRVCVGPGACQGAQSCQADLTWTVCDCGGSAGGSGSTGGASSASAGGSTHTGVGGGNAATGGDQTVAGASATGGATGVSATGGNVATGGTVSSGGGTTAASAGGAVATGGRATTGGANPGTGGTTFSSIYITATDGWATEVSHAVEGPLYTYTDSGGSNIYPDCSTSGNCFAGTGVITQFCASGTVAQALDSSGLNCQLTSSLCDWTTYWGTGMAINLKQVAGTTIPTAWDGSAYTGISFDLTVNASPPSLRVFIVLMDDTEYCVTLSTSKTYALPWAQFRQDCYNTGGATLSGTALTKIKGIAWQAGTNASSAVHYDFCVNAVRITP